MRKHNMILNLAAASILLAANIAIAQEQPAPQPSSSSTASATVVPARGSTMESVKSKFGAPTQEVPAVGRPPITRWEYPGYVVFFENDRVLHTVVAR
jgi:hypothetical protein